MLASHTATCGKTFASDDCLESGGSAIRTFAAYCQLASAHDAAYCSGLSHGRSARLSVNRLCGGIQAAAGCGRSASRSWRETVSGHVEYDGALPSWRSPAALPNDPGVELTGYKRHRQGENALAESSALVNSTYIA